MYIVKRTNKEHGTFSYLTYNGWGRHKEHEILDLSDAVRLTKMEATNNPPPSGYEYQWFGCYKELKQ